jgi:hypothetical protein
VRVAFGPDSTYHGLVSTPIRHARSAGAALRVVAFALPALAVGCVAVLGDDYEIVEGATTSSSSSATSTSTTTTSTSSSTATTTTTTTPVVYCTSPTQCDSGNCVDGVCCDSACDGPCVACDAEAHVGVCRPTAGGSDDPACTAGVCDGAGSCATGALGWAYNYGDSAGQWMRNVTVDHQGNVVTIVHYDGTIDFGDGAHTTTLSDAFVAKHLPDGTLQWSRVFGHGDDATEFPQGVAADASGNITVAGTFTGTITFGTDTYTASAPNHFDIFLVKLGPSGNVLWSKTFATSSDFFFFATLELDCAADGSIVLAASVVGGVDLGGGTMTSIGGWDIVVGAFDPNGNHQWSDRFGGDGFDAVASIRLDAAGDVLVTGFFSGVVDFGTSEGAMTSAGGLDAFLLKLGSNYDGQWVRAWGDVLGQSGVNVATDAERNVLVSGFWAGSINFGGGARFTADTPEPYVAKFTPDGDYLWDVRAGDTVTDGWATAVATTAGGAVVVGGWFGGTASFGGPPLVSDGAARDAYLVELGPDGSFVWSKSFGTAAEDSVQGLRLSPIDDTIAIAGFMGTGTLTIDGTDLTSVGSADAFVAKLEH